ncbi:SAFB-like transcription modulator isoform X2 [Stegostoma tigrinum]|uniref:SAFB-like transcription modulator isoform X2 n=1 Tax=Stegostoma tigrinum TaxID=3053191 RepID=UPI00286FC233|nr:SAFB-like transcription modulator isoform X2 [Stegostoma tigrinum]
MVIEEEGGDPDNVQLFSDTPSKKTPKSKGRRQDNDEAGGDVSTEDDGNSKMEADVDATQSDSQDTSDQDGLEEQKGVEAEEMEKNDDSVMGELPTSGDDELDAKTPDDEEQEDQAEEENEELVLEEVDVLLPEEIFQEPEEDENYKDVDDIDDGSREVSKSLPSEQGLAEAQQTVQVETEPSASLKEVDDDNISVTIQAEDAITLDFDGDDLLETGKTVKTPEGENKSKAEKESPSQDDVKGEVKIEGKKEKNHKEGRKEEGIKSDSAKKETREGSRKAEAGDKEKDSSKKGPSSSGASNQAKSSSKDSKDKTATKDEKGVNSTVGTSSGGTSSSTKNLWISGLSSNTKAADLKNLFSKYGKVLSAKVVTNARSPGARCYGFVTMSSSAEMSRCISHLHRTELHGQQIFVERVKNDPFKKESITKDGTGKTGSSRSSSDKKSSTGGKTASKTQVSSKKEDKKTEKPGERKESKDGSSSSKKSENKKDDKESAASASHDHSKKVEEKRRRSVKSSHRMVVIDKTKGEPVVSVKTAKKGKSEQTSISRSKERHIPCKPSSRDRKDILPFEKIKQQKIRERLIRLERIRRAIELRRRREIAERQRRERERIRMIREREERDRLQRERERLEIEKQKLERERMERERLERERIRIEQERRKEIERIAREREELRRQQEQLRYEQERRNSLKRPPDVDNRRDDPYWNEHKRRAMDHDARFGHGSDYSRQEPNRYNDFDHRVPSFDRRGDRYNHQGEGKKNRSGSRREDTGYNRYPKPYNDSRRPSSQQRSELHANTDRREIRERDDRRTVTIQDRSAASRGHEHLQKMSPSRNFTDRNRMEDHGVHHSRPSHNSSRPDDWKPSGSLGSTKHELRTSRERDRMRPERSGQNIRSGPPSGMAGYNSRDGGRPAIGDRGGNSQQSHYHDNRHVVVERHGRDSGGPRNSWHPGPGSQGTGYQDMRRMSDSRGPGMIPLSSPSVANRIVQITNNTMQGGSVSGSKGIHGSGDARFKPFKGGAPRRF